MTDRTTDHQTGDRGAADPAADGRRIVEEGYDRVAESYLASKREIPPALLTLLERTVADTPREGRVVDLGCGAGVPITAWLADRARVTGVDISARQLELARANVPRAGLIKADMAEVDFPPDSIAAVVASYSIIHLPRDLHPPLLGRIARWLVPGGRFLATWPRTAWEGAEEDWMEWGASMWWSHHDEATNRGMLREVGFELEHAELIADGDETWLWVLARKPS